MKAEELGNNMGYSCPRCKRGDQLTISASVRVQARLVPDGTDSDYGDTEWEEEDAACCGCGWEGKVVDLNLLATLED